VFRPTLSWQRAIQLIVFTSNFISAAVPVTQMLL
jgi:hypothetical protein